MSSLDLSLCPNLLLSGVELEMFGWMHYISEIQAHESQSVCV